MNIALISPPWPLFNRPSIQIGALKAYLDKNLKDSKTYCFHPYLKIAENIGFDTYHLISQSSWASESVFSSLLFPENKKAEELFYKSLGKRFKSKKNALNFKELSEACKKTADNYIASLNFGSFQLVGISVCLNQLTSGLYFAQKIRSYWPNLKIVLGGASVSGEIGSSIKRLFPFIDFIISGEGEKPLLELCLAIKKGKSFNFNKKRCQVKDLNSLPPPNYDHYFKELFSIKGASGIQVVLPIEASRGCWWGRCAFCNLNLQWSGYRAKTPKKIAEEVDFLCKRFNQIDFAFMDNCLPRRGASEIFKALSRHDRDYSFFAEIRAVHSLSELKEMKKAGLKDLQVGIEALSTSLLNRLKKGSTAIKNLAMMRHCKELGINLQANLITEFPGTTEKEVEETLEYLEFIWPFFILKPVSFWLGFESPVFHDLKRYKIKTIKPHRYYNYLFPNELFKQLAPLILEYSADRTLQKRLWRPVYNRLKVLSIQQQKLKSKEPFLIYRDGGHFLTVRQVLPNGQILRHKLFGISRRIYLECIEPKKLDQIFNLAPEIPTHKIRAFINDLFSKKLIFKEDDEVLSLAIKAPSYEVV